MANVLGSPNTGLQPDTWYSIQSYATDYYVGVGNSSTISQLSSNSDDTSLWQFLPGSAIGSYAIRSKSSEGRYCLHPGPALQTCGSTSAQYRVFNAASDDGADIFVPSLSSEDAALHVSSDSSQGDAVETADPADDVEFFFAISSVSAVDTSAYPTALPSSSPTSIASSVSSSSTLTTSTSQPTSPSTSTPSSSSSSASQSLSSSSATEDTTSSTPAPATDAAPSTASSTVVITEEAPVTDAASPATSTVLVDPVTTGSSTAASMSTSPTVELSTGAGVINGVRMRFVGLAVLGAGVWLL